MDRILVVGASGMLGSALLRVLGSRRLGHVAPTRHEFDLERGDIAAGLAVIGPSAVVNAAAYTDVARAELIAEREAVFRLNRDAPAELARACRVLGVPLVHLSTDYVFDGNKTTPYREDDLPAPLQVYGQSKLEGERAILETHDTALVVRTSTMYGPRRGDRRHYVGAVLSQARERDRLEVVRLPVSSPTYSLDLAAALIDLLETGARGIVHVVNHGGCSRGELALEIVRLAGLAASTEVHERAPAADPPRRPSYSVLDTSRFTELTGRTMRPWQDGLAAYLALGEA